MWEILTQGIWQRYPYVLIEKQNSEISAGIEPNSEIDEFSEINREISDAIDQASKHAAGSNGIFDSLNSEDNTDDRIHQKKIISILNATKTYNNEEQTHDIFFQQKNWII
ncbi:unnamed protein product [Rhizophagus irregularis]|nr:unnamed protein product [Rhizophagus irregularis]